MSRTYVGRRHDGQHQVEVLCPSGRSGVLEPDRPSASGYGWGSRGAGSVTLARAILRDLGVVAGDGLAITFAGDVLSWLPEAEFRLEEADVRSWLDGQLERRISPHELVEHLGSIALAEPEEEAEVLRGLVDRCWSAQGLLN